MEESLESNEGFFTKSIAASYCLAFGRDIDVGAGM